MDKKLISITDIDGFKVGHAQNYEGGSGCTVILCEGGAAAGCDVRGGAPASRETELLKPVNTVEKIHAVMLSGGSAFGLDAGSGAMQYLEEKGIGVEVAPWKVPLVCGASIFDFPASNGKYKPDKALGYEACLNASNGEIACGNVGAGTGATVGKLFGTQHAMKSGIGCYGLQIGDLKTAAIVCVNALGDVIDIDTGKRVAGLLNPEKNAVISTAEALLCSAAAPVFSGNTTIGCIATNAALTKSQLNKAASMAHNGYARAINPVHTTADGDTIFIMSTETVPAAVDVVGVMAAECMARAILCAVKAAKGLYGFIAAEDL